MRGSRVLCLLVISGGLCSAAAAQATGLPSFNAPYRAFQRSEIGLVLTFPDPGGAGNATLLVGAEARERVVTHTEDFPLDGALILGVGGAFVSGNSELFVPVGLSLGRRIDPKNSTISIVPYVQPTGLLAAGSGNSDFFFTLGLGTDFRLSPRFDARISAGLGDVEGVSISAVWVH